MDKHFVSIEEYDLDKITSWLNHLVKNNPHSVVTVVGFTSAKQGDAGVKAKHFCLVQISKDADLR